MPRPFDQSPTLPSPEAPSPPILKTPNSTFSDEESSIPGPSIFVKRVEVLGNTVLQTELADLLEPWQNRENVTFDQLLDLRSQIADLYIQNGYVTSGAFLPTNQNLSSGIVRIQVVEGELEDLQITGLKRLKKSYIRDRLKSATKPPHESAAFRTSLSTPPTKSPDSICECGVNRRHIARTDRVYLVDVQRNPEFHLSAGVDNYRSPSIGTWQGTLEVSHDNVIGYGDSFQGAYSISDGLNLFDLSYEFPFNAKDGTVGIRYSNGDSEIIESDFREFDIKSESQTVSVSLRQPILKNPNREVALGVAFDLQDTRTFIFGDRPFSFSLGPDNGVSKLRVLRLSQDWIDRRATRVLAARSQFNVGLDALDATVNSQGPSAKFWSWLGQFQWVQQLSGKTVAVTRLSTQLTL